MVDAMNAALLLIALFLFVWWFYGPWQKLCVDWGRQQLFEARNALFDLAADGRLSFDSWEYKTIRSEMEAVIRFSHRISWVRLVIYQILDRPRGRKSEMIEAINRIADPAVRDEAMRQCAIGAKGAIRIMLFRSMIGLVAFALVWLITRAYKPARQPVRQTRQAVYRHIREDATRYEGRATAPGHPAWSSR